MAGSDARRTAETEDLLASQRAYYRARAAEYDDWFFRRDRYDRGPEHRGRWFAEAEQVRSALRADLPAGGAVLELACGTGIWTAELVREAGSVLALDASPEVLELARARVGSAPVEWVCTDLFAWEPPRRFDLVFFGFWLSHVPPGRFDGFWRLVERSLRPGGRVFFVDNAPHRQYSPADVVAPADEPWRARRNLRDGREFDIVKIFWQPAELEQRLAALGWSGRVESTESFFLLGRLHRTPSGGRGD